jgi:hypothetical protein
MKKMMMLFHLNFVPLRHSSNGKDHLGIYPLPGAIMTEAKS